MKQEFHWCFFDAILQKPSLEKEKYKVWQGGGDIQMPYIENFRKNKKGGMAILNNTNKKQMKLPLFCESFDIPRSIALKWAYSEGFPAYNLCGHWYVDIPMFYTWREKQHNLQK